MFFVISMWWTRRNGFPRNAPVMLQRFSTGSGQKVDELRSASSFHATTGRRACKAGLLQSSQSLARRLVTYIRKAKSSKLTRPNCPVQIKLHQRPDVTLHQYEVFLLRFRFERFVSQANLRAPHFESLRDQCALGAQLSTPKIRF